MTELSSIVKEEAERLSKWTEYVHPGSIEDFIKSISILVNLKLQEHNHSVISMNVGDMSLCVTITRYLLNWLTSALSKREDSRFKESKRPYHEIYHFVKSILQSPPMESADLMEEERSKEVVIVPNVPYKCKRCGKRTLRATTVQTRSFDEAATIFYQCMNCDYVNTEY